MVYSYGGKMSRTTVEVKKNTLQALEELKAKLGTKSFDETIQELIRRVGRIPKSKFGAHPEMTAFTPEDEAKVHEL
jgi:predicted CopG family antitoxin